ncbi:MAG: serine/threonine-protein kinase [Gemmatimonadaceae bacterium]
MAAAAAPDPSLEPSRRVIADRYEVVSVIGQGSAARTLLCADLREERRVVVKELHFAHLSDWKHLELFEREAKMLARLQHPNIPRCFDYFQGAGESATFYIVQEFIEGPSLLQRMESGPMLGQKEIREIAIGLLDVLEYLHGRAPPIIHRDIKPSNVLLRADGTPALIDFGGIRAAWQPRDAAGATVVGTFGYMAPEQSLGKATAASDLYSLGATLLHLVTGLPPSAFPFDSGRIEVPDDLPTDRAVANLIEALLRPAPRDRPPSAEAARALLTDPAPRKAGRAMTPHAKQLPATPPRKSIFGASGEPRFVDMGNPPRDPRGELRDVYRNLMHPYFPARRAWSDTEHLFWVGFAGAASLVTLGAAPAIYGWLLRKRRMRYDDLFRFGSFTTGTIRSIPKTDIALSTMIRYEFEVGGIPLQGYFEQPGEMSRYWSAGDAVAVLYDREDPSRSCIVHR